jgi:hypothetical protein
VIDVCPAARNSPSVQGTHSRSAMDCDSKSR